MTKTTDTIRLLTALLLGASAGIALTKNLRELARDVATDRRDGMDEEIRRVLWETTRKAAN